ncbi:MAG: DotA/TraY family protein [Desulfovibrio sp.]|nr:DotA/TraY family protein [Desulfovibrio sp.]
MPPTDPVQLLVRQEPPATDLSREVLSTIFGDNWWDTSVASLPSQGIFDMLMTLNAIACAVIAWLMILTLIVSSVGAAQEGRAMGGKYKTPWIPLRFAFSIAAVTPVHHGLCAMQIMLLCCVGASVNMANTMLDTALDWIRQNGTLSAVNSRSAGESYSLTGNSLDVGNAITGASKTGGKTLAVQILETEAFLTYLNRELGCSTPDRNFASHLRTETDGESGETVLLFVPDGRIECQRGYVQKNPRDFGGFSLPMTVKDDIRVALPAEIRIGLLKELITAVEESGAPERFASMRMRGEEMADVSRLRQTIHALGVRYALALSAKARGQGKRSKEMQARLDAQQAGISGLGWFGLGSHYWTLATLEQELTAFDDVHVGWIEPRFRSFSELLPASFVTAFWPRIREAASLGETPSADLWAKILESISPFTGMSKRFANALGESPDALLAMVSLARWTSGTCTSILVAAEASKLAAIGGTKLLTKNVAGRVADFFTGGGEASESVAKAAIQDFSFFLRLIILPIWAFSTFVAYLVPAIPFLIWLAAIAGWVVLTLEAVIAAPLWLIGHAMPEGEGFAGLHGRSGYMLVLSVLLRPALLVLSMLTCFIVMRATGSIIGALLGPFIDAEAGMSAISLGIVGCIFLFIIICGATTLLTWKLFELVTQMPDRIIRWIGQQIASLGSESSQAMGMNTFRAAERNAAVLARAGGGALARGLGTGSTAGLMRPWAERGHLRTRRLDP